jgi:hypothetical protein
MLRTASRPARYCVRLIAPASVAGVLRMASYPTSMAGPIAVHSTRQCGGAGDQRL